MTKRLSKTEWLKLKRYILERDCYCLKCGTTSNLTPAHIIRRSQGGSDSKGNVICLCVNCHQAFDLYKTDLPDSVYSMLETEKESEK